MCFGACHLIVILEKFCVDLLPPQVSCLVEANTADVDVSRAHRWNIIFGNVFLVVAILYKMLLICFIGGNPRVVTSWTRSAKRSRQLGECLVGLGGLWVAVGS